MKFNFFIKNSNKYLKFHNFYYKTRVLFTQDNRNKNSSIPRISIEDIKSRLRKEGKLKLYETTYYYAMEKIIVRGSFFASIICCLTLFSNVPVFLKILNAIFLVPALSIQIENFKNQTRFVVSMHLLENGEKVSVLNHKNETEIFDIHDLKLATEDDRVKQKKSLNHENYTIFTNKSNDNVYHLFRGGIYLDEKLLDKILEGKNLNQ